MANEYLYGAYGHIGETVAQSAVQAGTTPVYIGTAPVNLVRGFGEAGIINAPIKITSLVDAQKKIGYSSDWGTFTLCEAVYAHFNNTLGNIGPIYVINVLDPSAGKHRKEAATTKTPRLHRRPCRVRQQHDHPRHADHRKGDQRQLRRGL